MNHPMSGKIKSQDSYSGATSPSHAEIGLMHFMLLNRCKTGS